MPVVEVIPGSKPTPKTSFKPLDLESLDSAGVRDRIKQWQTVSGAALAKKDEFQIAEAFKQEIEQLRSGSLPSHKRSKSFGALVHEVEPPSKPPSTQAEEEIVQQTPATDRRPKANRLNTELKNASAPKRRVVDDGHWVRKQEEVTKQPEVVWIRKQEEVTKHPEGAWIRKHEDPEDQKPEIEGAWIRRHPPPEDDKPEVHYSWIRDPVLPRNNQSSPPKATDVKVYAAQRPRRKSFAAPEKAGNNNVETRKAPSPVRKTTPRRSSPVKGGNFTPPNIVEVSPLKAPREKISDWARNITPPSASVLAANAFEESTASLHRSSRNRRAAEAPSYYEETKPTPDRRRKKVIEVRPSSPEPTAELSYSTSRRRRSADELKKRPAVKRKNSSLQHSTEQIEAIEFPRDRPSSHRRGKSVGPSLTERTRKRYYDEAEEKYIQSGRRRPSYREEYENYASPERDSPPGRRTSAYGRSRVLDQYDSPQYDEEPAQIEVFPPGMFGNRVEAWLSGTNDPFTETASEAPKSRRAFSYEQKSSQQSPSVQESTSRRTDAFDMRKSSQSSSRRLKVDTSHDKVRFISPQQSDVSMDQDAIDVEYSSATSVPSSLKRRGATKNATSPTKERAHSPSLVESNIQSEVADSVVSSSVDASKFVPPDAPARHSAANATSRRVTFTSKRLSTIVSEGSLNAKTQQAPSVTETGSEISESTVRPPAVDDPSDTITRLTTDEQIVASTAIKSKTSLKRRLTKHSDLISVLSMDGPPRSKSIVSARSIRTHRSRLETATIADLMKELATDEAKYIRELKTLADGVIVVLLKCVLSKSDVVLAAGLYSKAPSKDDIAKATNLIRDLGVALNRLKTLHSRIPTEDAEKFINWAQSAQRVYSDYVKTWRMGFEDVVVSLSTTDDGKSTVSEAKSSVQGGSWDDGLPRNDDGYVVDGDGVRVDVAFLLKRPLIRLKYLSKTVKGINFLKPSTKAESLQKTFEELLDTAKRRVNEEKARVEDEAAANIDATRTRDLKTLAPIAGVTIERERCVRARDHFDLHVHHTSGQMVDCRVELLLRDNPRGDKNKGDLLVCEIENTSRWLFLPPITLDRLSARKSDIIGEVVVMVRGQSSDGTEWHELLSLYCDDDDVADEWIQMLGTVPVPPRIEELLSTKSTPLERPASSYISSSYESDRSGSTVPEKSRTPSLREIDIPIGEKARSSSKRWSYGSTGPEYAYEKRPPTPITPPTSESEFRIRIKEPEPKKSSEPEKTTPSRWSAFKDKFNLRKDGHSQSPSSLGSEGDQTLRNLSPRDPIPRDLTPKDRTPRDLNEAMSFAGTDSAGLRRAKATKSRLSPKNSPADNSPFLQDHKLPESTDSELSTGSPKKLSRRPKEQLKRSDTIKTGFSVWIPPSTADAEDDSDESDIDSDFTSSSNRPVLSQRQNFEQWVSSVPTSQSPTVSKLRKGSLPATSSAPTTPPKDSPQAHTLHAPSSAPSKLQKKHANFSAPLKMPKEDTPPLPPPHRTPSSNHSPTKSSQQSPQFTPTPHSKRMSSSPLKHEYQPSSASSSSYDSESDYDDSDTESITSESEDELDDEDDAMSYLGPSLIPTAKRAPPTPMSSQKLYSIPEATIKPGDSASQLHAQQPYRQVPQPSSTAPTGPTTKVIASIFAWSDSGAWEQLYPDECSVVISPGLISAFELTAAHNTAGSSVPLRPLVALELTPHVVTRRGTGLDVSVRSPATPYSQLRVPSGTVMFRSRSADECDALYQLMWQAKLNNPTFLALESARPKPSAWADAMDASADTTKKWFSFGSGASSPRDDARDRTSDAGRTDSSVRTISSVMNAMKRFSGLDRGSRLFVPGRDKASSGSDGEGNDGSRTPPSFVDPADGAAVPEGLGITNAKIRLYVRETRGKWADLGTARLSVLQKRERNPETLSEVGVDAPIALRTGLEKRILVHSKGGEELLLDATLGEACFERVARTGIAVSVWEDVAHGGAVAATGGVAEKRVRIYMIQVCSKVVRMVEELIC